jgi:hypothetical protein
MNLSELQRTLTSVEPAAVLVPPRVMEAIIRHILKLSGMVWSVPHAQSWIVDRTLLFRHVDQADLVLAADQVLPATVILLSWPNEENLLRDKQKTVLLQLWRQLFHATVHQAVDRCWEDGTLTPARLRDHIEAIGPTAFEEIQLILTQENILMADARDRAVFDEFAATFLELFHFAPTLLASFFPGLTDPQQIKDLLEGDLGSDALLRKTRLPHAPDPIVAAEETTSEANEFFRDLEGSSRNALEQGNMVQAAIQLQRAVRVAPADEAFQTRKQAERILADVVHRLKDALELPNDEVNGWSRLLPILLDKADQGSRPPEAALLYELQNICLDHEREMYKLDVVEYIMSAGRRPLKRPLPSQRLVRITRTLRGAVPNLTAARLSDTDRKELETLLQRALQRTENRVRLRFRPLVTNALQDVGLAAKNPLESVAFSKMVEEILDRVIDSGFLTFSDLRDTISRNQLKLPDLTEPQDFIRGDPLIRLDRRLATVLDGVYRPGEFYLRWLERFTALNFGTKLGRLFTRYVTVPVGGGFIIAFALIRIFHLQGPERTAPFEVDAPTAVVTHSSFFNLASISLWVAFSVIIFGLIHSHALRGNLVELGRTGIRGLRRGFVDFPLWVARHDTLNHLLSSTAFQLFSWYVIKPGIVTAVLVSLVPRFRNEPLEVLLCFLAANFLINSRPGEAIGQSLIKTFSDFFHLLRAGLLPGLIRFIERIFKQILNTIEGGLFTVDEWLRFRGGESNSRVFLRSIATLIWMPISYLARFNLVVLIEPCFNPLKFPVVTVATKFWIPLVPVVKPALASAVQPFLGGVLTEVFVWWIVFWLPDAFGFIFWEMKENWSLFRANRRQTLEPVPVGSHGETIRGYFQPGFYSGTIPKLFAKIRHAEAQAIPTGNYSAVRQYRAMLAEIEESLLKFMNREFSALLQQSSAWRGQALTTHHVDLSINRIRFHLAHPNFPEQPLLAILENRAGWIAADISPAPWLVSLSSEAQADLHNALIMLYKYAGVDLVCEQIRASLPSPLDRFDFSEKGLVIWPADRHGKELNVDLRPDGEPNETPDVDPSISVLIWDPERVLFGNHPLTRGECLAVWSPRLDRSLPPPRLMPDVPILPNVAEIPIPITTPPSNGAIAENQLVAMDGS